LVYQYDILKEWKDLEDSEIGSCDLIMFAENWMQAIKNKRNKANYMITNYKKKKRATRESKWKELMNMNQLCETKRKRMVLAKLFTLLLIMLSSNTIYSQETLRFDLQGVSKRRFLAGQTRINEGDTLRIMGLTTGNPDYPSFVSAFHSSGAIGFGISGLRNIEFIGEQDNKLFWDIAKINSNMLNEFAKTGFNYNLRRELMDEANEYILRLEALSAFFDDEYLLDYLQRLLLRIHPSTLGDGRPGTLTIRVIKSSYPNAYSFPNGSIVVTTGMLSLIRSEEELLGVLAHEVAHFVLDHHVVNILKQQQRQRRAEFWAGITTTMAMASELYLAAEHDIYTGGEITRAAFTASVLVANEIVERMGNVYSQGQETEADKVAYDFLSSIGKNHSAYSTVMQRFIEYAFVNGYTFALSDGGSHPNLSLRVAGKGFVEPERNDVIKYDRIISFINTFNASHEYGLGNYSTAYQLTLRNIVAAVGVEMDYILNSMALRALNDTQEVNQSALELLIKAKTLKVQPNIYVYKQEGLVLLRLNRNTEAIRAFNDYLHALNKLYDNNPSDELHNEINWTLKMIYKSEIL